MTPLVLARKSSCPHENFLTRSTQFFISVVLHLQGGIAIRSVFSAGNSLADTTASSICLEYVFQHCTSLHLDLAIVGHGLSFQERAEFVRCIQGVFRLPVILIVEGELLGSIRADSHIDVNAPIEKLVCAIKRLFGEEQSRAVAV